MGSWMFPLPLLCLALVSGVSSVTVKIPDPKYEFARGESIILPCTFQTKLTDPGLVIVTWSAVKIKAEAEDTVISTYYSHTGRTDYTGKYERRSKVDVDVKAGTSTLRLYNSTMNDNRNYECRLQIPGDDEGTPADSTEVVVLVAPSTPICNTEGKLEYGQDIKLTCFSEEGSPTPTYKWEVRNVQNMSRPRDPKTTEEGGVLSLFNITKDTSGYYTCTSANRIRSATCTITLKVMPPSMMGSVAQTAGIAAAVVGALLILIIVIYCCCCKKKKGKDEEYAMGVREEEYVDKEPTENGERRDDSRVERDTRDRRSDYDDRPSDYDDRRSDYDDRRRDYDDRRSDYDDRRSDYTERRSDYDDRRSDYTERRDRYDDDRDRRDRRYDDDRRDRTYDDAYDDRPPVPNNKPPRRDYDE